MAAARTSVSSDNTPTLVDEESGESLPAINAAPPTRRVPWSVVFKYLLYIAPFIGAINDSAQFRLGLDDEMGERFLGLKLTPQAINVLLVTYFIQDFQVNSQWTVDGLQEVWGMIRTRRFPESWPRLSTSKEVLAGFFFLSTSGFASFADWIANYTFLSQQNITPFLSNLIGGSSAFTNVFSECLQAYSLERSFLAEPEEKQVEAPLESTVVDNILAAQNNALDDTGSEVKSEAETDQTPIDKLAKIFGYPFAVLSALQDTYEAYVVVVLAFNIEDLLTKSILLAASTANGFNDLCYGGYMGVRALDAFVKELKSITSLTALKELIFSEKSIAFIAALYSAGVVASAQYEVNNTTCSKVKLPFYISDIVFQEMIKVLSWSMAARNCVVNTHYTLPLFQKVVGFFSSGFNALYERFISRRSYQRVQTEESTVATNGLFAPPAVAKGGSQIAPDSPSAGPHFK